MYTQGHHNNVYPGYIRYNSDIDKHQQCILKAKSNFTLWTIEYIFTVFELNQIKYCNKLLVPALS